MTLGVRAMARELGCAPSLVSRYKGAGMPLETTAAAREWLAANVRPDPRTPFSPPPPPADLGEDFQAARARREAAEADLAELKLAEQRGELVRAADVRAIYARRAAALRDGLRQIPARVASVVAAESDQARCHDVLQTEIDAVLSVLAEA
jgi:hypothetical protein